MEVNEFLFNLLLLFFPGIICAYIIDSLTVHRQRETVFFLLQSFVFGIVAYFVYWGVLGGLHYVLPAKINTTVTFLDNLTNATVKYSFREIFFVTIVAIIIGCTASVLSGNKLPHKLARKLLLTKKFGDMDVWGYFMNKEDVVWATVRDHPNNLVYDGWIEAFSDDSKDAELLLRDVSVYKNDTVEMTVPLLGCH